MRNDASIIINPKIAEVITSLASARTDGFPAELSHIKPPFTSIANAAKPETLTMK